MEMFLHRFTALFEQLGLPNDPESLGVPYTVLINPELSPIGDDRVQPTYV